MCIQTFSSDCKLVLCSFLFLGKRNSAPITTRFHDFYCYFDIFDNWPPDRGAFFIEEKFLNLAFLLAWCTSLTYAAELSGTSTDPFFSKKYYFSNGV